MRSEVRFSLRSRGLSGPLHGFCQRVRLVDEAGVPRRAEAMRLLMFSVLFRGAQDRVRATVEAAVRANKPMVVGAMCRRLTRMFTTTSAPVQQARGAVREPATVKVKLGDWLGNALQAFERSYRRPDGIVDDIRMVSDLVVSGLSDPAIEAIGLGYSARMEPIRATIAEIERVAAVRLYHGVGQERPLRAVSGVGG